MRRLHAFLLFFFTCHLSFSQTCESLQNPEYLSDGQYYNLIVNPNEKSKLYITFIEGFTYQIITCSDNHPQYEIKIFDTNMKQLFQDISESYNKSWELKFQSSVSCIAEFRLMGKPVKKSNINVLVGFK